MKSIRLTNILAFILLTLLTACGGSGGGGGTGPTVLGGDYFPYNEGNRWGYQTLVSVNGAPQNANLEFLKITGTVAVGAETAAVLEEFNPENASLFGGRYIFREDGLYYAGEANGADVFGLGIYKVANLPLRTGDSFTQIERSGLDFGVDMDGDGRNETLSLSSSVKVLGTENVSVPAGNFENCALLQTEATQILKLSSTGEQLVVNGVLKEWYAAGLGAVKRVIQYSGTGLSETDEFSLESYYVDGRSSEVATPEIVAAQPTGTNGQSTAGTISVQFNRDMDPTTFTPATFSLVDSQGGQVAGSVSYANRTATFYPSVPLGSASYTATVSTGVEDLAANPLPTSYSWNFTLDVTAPEIIQTIPAPLATNVSKTPTISVTFSEELNPASITSDTFRVIDSNGFSVYGDVTYANRTATLDLGYRRLDHGATYTAILSASVQDAYGNTLPAEYRWDFTIDPGLFASPVVIPTGSWPEAVAIGDINNDGRNDVVMTTSYYFDPANDYKLFVFYQDVSGNLLPAVKYATNATYTTSPRTVAIGDVNNDGRNDVVIGNSGNDIAVFLQDAAGNLALTANYVTTDSNKVRIADLNHDGLPDVVGIGWGTGTVSLFPQQADGTLGPPQVTSVTHGGYDDLEVGDVNNDGLSDVIVMSGQSLLPNLGILLQDPAGGLMAPTYYSIGASELTSGVAVGDVNGDSLADVIVSGGGNQPGAAIHIFFQNSSGRLDPAVGYTSYDVPEPIETADINGDGRLDIITLHGGWNAMGAYLQGVDGQLAAEDLYGIPYASHYNPHGLALGDIDSDGRPDAVIADYNSGLVVLYNTYVPQVTPATQAFSVQPVASRRLNFKGINLR